MSEFETRLDECLEALREGRWSIDDCLRENPKHASKLRPYLTAASAFASAFDAEPSEEFAAAARARYQVATGQALENAFSVEPRPEFADASRERFLVATGQRVQEAFNVEPSPSFFAAARVRLLMTAHLRRREQVTSSRWRLPSLMPGMRAFGGLAAALVLLFSFSTYTVASASSALPGDWQYPVKLQTERVRLALAFNDGDKRDVRLDIAHERVNEIETLTKKGRIIGPGALRRLANQTQPLLNDVHNGDLDAEDLAKLQDLSVKQEHALTVAAEQVDPDAQDELATAQNVAQDVFAEATKQLVTGADTPQVIKPTLPLTATPEGAIAGDATAETTPPALLTPVATETAAGPAASPTPTATATEVGRISTAPTGDATLGLTWVRLTVGRLTALIPSEADGWHIVGIDASSGSAPAPALVRLSNADATSLITLNPFNGDIYWHISHDGRFDEVDMRLDQNGTVLIVDRDVLLAAYGALADVPLYVLDSVKLEPLPPSPTPEPSATPHP